MINKKIEMIIRIPEGPDRDKRLVDKDIVETMYRPVRDGRKYPGTFSTDLLCLTAHKFSRISGVDFTNHSPDKISFMPPEHLLSES